MNGSHSIGEQVLDPTQIQDGVETVARQLNGRFRNLATQDEAVVIITVVPGGILFTADLVRRLEFDLCMDFISCPHRPGDRKNSSIIVYPQNIKINDRHVIVIDDAIESGGTMTRLVAYLSDGFGAKSISVATLFVKPGRVSIPVNLHFAYEVENDDLLVGYGLPWNELSRNLPYIARVVQS